jgi:hypothetical protein
MSCPEFVSPADPAARWTGAHGGQAFAYSTDSLIAVDLLAAGPTAAIIDGISALQSGEVIVSTVIQSNTQNGHFPHWKLKTGGVIMPDERLSWVQTIVSGLQHGVAMAGGTIIAPLIMGFDPNLALFFSGVGTLIFFLVVGGRVPSYLGSSFSFIAVVIAASAYSGHGPNPNLDVALGGIVAAGVLYGIIALIVMQSGVGWVDRLMPPVVTGGGRGHRAQPCSRGGQGREREPVRCVYRTDHRGHCWSSRGIGSWAVAAAAGYYWCHCRIPAVSAACERPRIGKAYRLRCTSRSAMDWTPEIHRSLVSRQCRFLDRARGNHSGG